MVAASSPNTSKHFILLLILKIIPNINIPDVGFPTWNLCCRYQAPPLFSSPPLDGEYSAAVTLL